MDSKFARDPDYTRRQIKIAARREFNTVGYFATDTNKIAKLADYSPGTFYRHFKDKIDIFIEIYRDWHLEQMQEIEHTLSLGGSIDEMAERLGEVVIGFYGTWKTLRASARVLAISEPRVANFKASVRDELVEKLALVRTHLKLPPVPEEKIVLFFMLGERIGDGIWDGDFNHPKLPPKAGEKALIQLIANFLRGT